MDAGRGLLTLLMERRADLRALGRDALDRLRALVAHLARGLAGDARSDLGVAVLRGLVRPAPAVAGLAGNRSGGRVYVPLDLGLAGVDGRGALIGELRPGLRGGLSRLLDV